MKIAIIVGINTDSLLRESFPKWLEDIPDKYFKLSKEKYDDNELGLGSDMGVAYYVYKKLHNKRGIIIDILSYKDIKLKKFNEYDMIFGLYEPYYYFTDNRVHKGEPKKALNNYNKYCSIIQKYKGIYDHPLPLIKYILDKKRYLTDCKKIGIPINDTLFYNLKTSNMERMNKLIQQIKNKCQREWMTGTFITKPEMVGFSKGFRKWGLSEVDSKQFKNYIKEMKKYKYPKLLIQYFVPDFEVFNEVRLYWINGKYSHSIGTIIQPDSLNSDWEHISFSYPENESDEGDYVIDMKLMNQLKKYSKKVFDILPKDKNNKYPLILRIDFGCCLNNKNLCRDYFLNEIEYMPNLFPDYNPYKEPLEAFGKEIIRRINHWKS